MSKFDTVIKVWNRIDQETPFGFPLFLTVFALILLAIVRFALWLFQ